jgi:hypothetical protein
VSKEIAQTVGGKRIAWLLAIVAAFAVMATLGTQWRSSEAVLPTTTATLSQSPAGPANVNPGSTITYTLTVVLSADMSAGTDDLTLELTAPVNLGSPVVACGGGSLALNGSVCHQDDNVLAGTYTMTITGTAPASGTVAPATGARVCYDANDNLSCTGEADLVNATSAGSVGTLTVNGVAGSVVGTPVAGGNVTFSFSVPDGLTACQDTGDMVGYVPVAADFTIGNGTFVSATAATNADPRVTFVTVAPAAAGNVTATISTHLEGAAQGVGCTASTLVTAVPVVPVLRHRADDGSTIALQELNNNVRGSTHTICTTDGTAGVVLPVGITLSNIVVTNGGGYASTIDTDPTFSDVVINTMSIGGATGTCVTWRSLDAGDQTINILYVGVDGVQYNVLWGSGQGIVKEWNRLEDSTLTLTGGATGEVSGTGATGAISRSIGVVLNPSTGLYQFNAVNLTDVFRGSHTNSAGAKEGPMALAGVNWTVALAGGSCGVLTGTLSGTTTLNSAGAVVGGPSVSFDEGGVGVNCGPGRTATINFTGTEPGPLGSGTGITVTESATFTFTTQIAAKQVFLAWAGQRIILEHDWRIAPGDHGLTTDGPIPDGACPFDDVARTAPNTTFSVKYIKGSGPGNFLPSLGAIISGNDQAVVTVGADDDSQTIQIGPSQDDDIPGDPNGTCISRVLFESEDQGQVDIEAFVDGGNLNVTKHAFVIYYMKINTINVSLATQFSKPTHNSSAIPDWSNTGGTGAPTNPWDASKDDADNAAEWNVSKDLLVRGRVTGWFVNSNPSGRARDDSNPLNVLPADRWVLPNDWALLAGGPADAADGSAAIGTAEQFRPYYDIIFGPNQTSTVMVGSPDGVGYQSATTVVASATNTATVFRVASCSQFAGVAAGTALLVGSTTGVTFTSCVFDAAAGTSTLTVAGLSAAPAAGTPIFILAGVPFEGPYSLLDIPGLAVQGKGGAALSNLTGFVGGIRDTIRADGDVNMWDAPMPPAPVSVQIRGTGFIKQVLKQDVYYLGAPSGTNSTAAQSFNNPFYIANIPDSPFIPAIVVGGGYFWDSWGSDGPGGLGQGVYRFWQPAIIGTNSAGVGDALTATDTAELAIIRAAYGNDSTIARDLVVYTDNHGEFMVAANGDFKTVLTACQTNVLALGKHCAPGDKVGTGTITATVDYPDFRGKHFPVLSNAATVDWTWGGYKDVTVEKGEADQFKYIVFHAIDRDGFCSNSSGAVLLHSVLGTSPSTYLGMDDADTDFSSLGARYNGDPVENVDFLIDSGEGIIIGSSPYFTSLGKINDGKQFGTGLLTFSKALNDPATSGVLEFDLSPLAAEGQTDECQAWIKVSNSLLGVLNVLTIAHDDEGNIGFDRVIDLTNTHSYSLSFRWSLITWIGADAISVNDAIKGTGDAGKNPGGNDISASVTAIYGWDAAAQQWLGFFPSGVNVPGANDLTSLKTGDAYWIAITGPSSVTWTIASNVN